MESDKRVLLAAALSAIFVSVYSSAILKPAAMAQKRMTAINAPQVISADASSYHRAEEDVITMESDAIRLEVCKSSAAVRKAILKTFQVQFNPPYPLFEIAGHGRWILKQEAQRSLTFQAAGASSEYQLTYELSAEQPVLNVAVATGGTGISDVHMISSWDRGDALGSRNNQLELSALVQAKDKTRYFRSGQSRKERNVPRGTFLLSLAERFFCLSIKSEQPLTVKILPSFDGHEIVAEAQAPAGATPYKAAIYFGPRDYFYLRQAGFEQAFAIGTIGQIGLTLLSALKWIASMTKNYGVAIICFSVGITLIISPLTLISFRSMKKMQELKPKVDQILAKYKNDQMKANQEVFALYREHKVSPLSGCLPMLLQMPILIALFQAMSHFIGFRGKTFLWISDLSLPDHVVHLPFALPLLGPYLNLLPIIMATAMFIQTRLSSSSMSGTESNPTAKMFSGPMMPIMFGVMFYQVPSGLVLYWLTNTLMSLVIYRIAKS